MSDLRVATAANVQAFNSLSHALDISGGKWAASIDNDALEDEAGRFRVWSGNLGALQKGHSSLDYRLRDSPLLSSNALKLLQELEKNLKEAYAIVSEARLPYEQQPRSKDSDNEEQDDDGFFSDDEDESGDDEDLDGSRTEMGMRFAEVVDIIDNLYKLSVRIRTPTIRLRSLKAASYKPTDPDTGADIMGAYAEYDDLHIKELLTSLRRPFMSDMQAEEDFLAVRLSAAITLRRRQFKYWKRHRDKLGVATISSEDTPMPGIPVTNQHSALLGEANLLEMTQYPTVLLPKDATSQKTGKTLLSGTEATHHHQSLDEIVDNKSVTSYAVTVKDIQGRGVDLPPPPKAATGDRDFECPYCYIICPARYGRGRAWRTHILQDLQPYCCTYDKCDRAEQLFRSRREWAEHEASHRKVWRCPEHPNAKYKSEIGLESHLRREHLDSFPESQLPTIVKVGETTTVDVREICPVCLAPAETEGLGDFQSHIANHLERIATFALPSGVEGESDGASGAASRGGSGSTGSLTVPTTVTDGDNHRDQALEISGLSFDDHTQIRRSHDRDLGTEIARATLSAETLSQIPDSSVDRREMIASQLELTVEREEPPQNDSQSDEQPENENTIESSEDGNPDELEKHLGQREAFRVHLLSMPGATMVRFYKRYGSWTGRAVFANGEAAAQAIDRFDKEQFPLIRLQQSATAPEKLKFSSSLLFEGKKVPATRQSTFDSQEAPGARDASPQSLSYDDEEQSYKKQPILSVSDIPTLRSLYRSRRLLQRDQSYAPNDAYNQIISFCYYDLTRLKVDAIVNSTNSGLFLSRAKTTLNNAVHRAAGPGLREETKSKGKLKPGQSELSRGHNLPSTWIIHAARPHYGKSKGMGQFNVLTECYRSVLRMASNYEFKTIAFPSLGVGVGFPPRIAARIALQEVREYLDAHADYTFERLIFCVNSAIDEKAYMDFFPVFFPPTHGDLDRARVSGISANRAALAAQILETRGQVQKVNEELSTDFSLLVPDFDDNIIREFSAIDASLASLRGFLLGPEEISRSLGDVNLICSVLQTTCSRLMETIVVAKDTKDSWDNNKKYWERYERYMRNTHGTDLVHLLMTCQDFVQHFDNIVTRNGTEAEEMAGWRASLESYGTRQKGDDGEGIRHHLDEVLYAREFRQKESVQSRNTIKLQQIPSLARLYQLGELGNRPTLARPSAIFNHVVCLAREDITLLEVDIMVNSTDVSFMGMGTLDRLVFKKGGPELRDQILQFGKCQEGNVKLTPGYMLPAKHILHVVPPEQYRKNTKDVLRGIYREILHTAMAMRATSVALPSIGTGMLNYPRRDSASLAMEEVKRFLESAETTNSVEKIIFVVYSSNDEFIYKSLLPVYFPPEEDVTEAPSTAPVELEGASMTVKPTGPPPRTLFGSVGEALRNVRSGKQPEISRDINSYEEHYLISFETHATDCPMCKDIDRLYSQGLDLCSRGYAQAQLLLSHMNMVEDQSVHTKPDRNGQYVKLMIPPELYPMSLKLLHTVEKSFRDDTRNAPFVAQSKNYADFLKDREHRGITPSDPTLKSPMQTLQGIKAVRVALWSDTEAKWSSIHTGGCSISIDEGKVDVRPLDTPDHQQAFLLSLQLSPTMTVEKHETNTQLILSGVTEMTLGLNLPNDLRHDRVLFLNSTPGNCDALRERLQHAIAKVNRSVEGLQPRGVDRISDRNMEALITDHDSKEQRGGTFSRLQSRVRKLMGATSSVSSRSNTSSQIRSSASPGGPNVPRTKSPDAAKDSHDSAAVFAFNEESREVLSPFADKILTQMTTDLMERSGSYLGQTTSDIIRRTGQPPVEVTLAIEELATKGHIHNTIDDGTWVISHPPAHLPVLSQQQTRGPSTERPEDAETSQDMNSLTARVFSYLDLPTTSTESHRGRTIHDIATALSADTTVIWVALRELAARGYIQRSSPTEEIWMVVARPQEIADTPASADVPKTDIGPTPKTSIPEPAPLTESQPSLSLITPSPNEPSPSVANLEQNDYLGGLWWTYPSSSGATWTHILKVLVDPRVLVDAGEAFDETEESIEVHRSIGREELGELMGKTRALERRSGDVGGLVGGEDDSGDASPDEDATKSDNTTQLIRYNATLLEDLQTKMSSAGVFEQNASGDTGAKKRTDAKKGKPFSYEAAKSASSWRDGRGDKDRKQAKLDRVLAGDIAEEELRHYADEDEERGLERRG